MFLSYLNEVYISVQFLRKNWKTWTLRVFQKVSQSLTMLVACSNFIQVYTCVHGVCNVYYRVFSPYAHIRILLLHGQHAGVQQPTAVNWEKALSPSLWGDAQGYQYKVRIIILKMLLSVL